MTKKTIFVMIFFTSCSSLPSLDYIELGQTTAKYLTGRNNFEITKEMYQKEEYSFIKLRIGRSAPVIMVLAYVNDGVFEWVGADNSKVYTYQGKIIELDGLGNDIKIQHYQSKISSILSSSSNNYAVDFYNPLLLSLNVNTEIFKSKNKKSSLKRLSNQEEFFEIVENMHAPMIRWKAKNYYYFDDAGVIFKTVQYTHPRMPAIDIEFYLK